MIEVLCCPFCGGQPQAYSYTSYVGEGAKPEYWGVRCEKCYVNRTSRKSQIAAIELWNRRCTDDTRHYLFDDSTQCVS